MVKLGSHTFAVRVDLRHVLLEKFKFDELVLGHVPNDVGLRHFKVFIGYRVCTDHFLEDSLLYLIQLA